MWGGIKGREAGGENEKTLSLFTRFRITKRRAGRAVGKKRRWRITEGEKHGIRDVKRHI